jgi:outer membrane protein assembly factor BamB
MNRATLLSFAALVALTAIVSLNVQGQEKPSGPEDPTEMALAEIKAMKVQPLDWPMWGGWSHRNNTPKGENMPEEWDTQSGKNILWSAPLGSQTYGNPVVANGKVYVGTNNHHGYIARFPKSLDMGVLVCIDEKTGKFLWQDSNQKLPTGRVHDWPDQGICATVYADGDRVWYVTNRGEIVCLDAEGFHDGENDGPYKQEDSENKDESDVIWRYDMMGQLGVSQHNMCSCSLLCVDNVLFVCTSNGVDETHVNIPAPNAPSFMAMDRDTAKVLWTDKSPGVNILHGQWSSPAYAELGGQKQVIFGGGDGYMYSFDPEGDGQGHGKLLWKFDCNPKTSLYSVSGKSERNHIIGTPVIYEGKIYVAVGEDPEHGEGNGHLWCIDPTKRGDVSPELAVDKAGKPITQRRLQAVDIKAGEMAAPNPNSAAVWHYVGFDKNGNKKLDFEEEMHRSCGTVVIKDDTLYIADFSGLVHCINAKTGEQKWTYDMFAASWGSPLLIDGKVYIGDEDGDVAIFRHGAEEMELIAEVNMGNSVYSTPVAANNTLFIANKSAIFAIGTKEK